MRKVVGYVSTRISGSTVYFEFEVDDDSTDEDIEAMATDAMFEEIDWSYEVEENE